MAKRNETTVSFYDVIDCGLYAYDKATICGCTAALANTLDEPVLELYDPSGRSFGLVCPDDADEDNETYSWTAVRFWGPEAEAIRNGGFETIDDALLYLVPFCQRDQKHVA